MAVAVETKKGAIVATVDTFRSLETLINSFEQAEISVTCAEVGDIGSAT